MQQKLDHHNRTGCRRLAYWHFKGLGTLHNWPVMCLWQSTLRTITSISSKGLWPCTTSSYSNLFYFVSTHIETLRRIYLKQSFSHRNKCVEEALKCLFVIIHEDFIFYVSDLQNKHGGSKAHIMVLFVDSGMCPENHQIEIGLKLSSPTIVPARPNGCAWDKAICKF